MHRGKRFIVFELTPISLHFDTSNEELNGRDGTFILHWYLIRVSLVYPRLKRDIG